MALLATLVTLAAPGTTLAQDPQTKLVLLPIGQPGSYFDLTMRPGQSRTLDVEIANAGDATIAARTYATDVYTIINGGFGGRLRGEAQTGTTNWLDYPTEVLDLRVGEDIRRTFAVSVPADTDPGEYITSVVLENDQPIRGTGSVALDQIVRQAVAVVVTVPGPRVPGLDIGTASHAVVAGRSVVSIAVENTGNVRLKPIVEVSVRDAEGTEVSHATVPMDTFYALTDTFVEVVLDSVLWPGPYTVQLTLDDARAGVTAGEAALAFVVEAPPVTTVAKDNVPGLSEILRGIEDGGSSLPVLGIVLVSGIGLGGIGALLVVLWRRRRTRIARP